MPRGFDPLARLSTPPRAGAVPGTSRAGDRDRIVGVGRTSNLGGRDCERTGFVRAPLAVRPPGKIAENHCLVASLPEIATTPPLFTAAIWTAVHGLPSTVADIVPLMGMSSGPVGSSPPRCRLIHPGRDNVYDTGSRHDLRVQPRGPPVPYDIDGTS